ncbi:hypothetical protein HY991_01780, partial [Candidatus Micrarchaeota archaeon]|nr:hypothetical protein [Candidatus Micrarchaeota archaeon]
DLADRLKGLKETREMPQYLINKSIRILQVIQKVHASLFAKNAGEWPLQGGRIMRVDLSKQPESIQHLLIQSSISFMKSEPMPIVVFEQDASSLPMGLIESVVQANAGLIVHSEKGINLSAFGGEKAKIELIGNEAVLTEEGERPKRFLVRPSHSQCTGKS